MPDTRPFHMPAELYDEDHCVCGFRAEGYTRGRAVANFSEEYGIPFNSVRVRKLYFREDTEGNAERLADGLEEPYDGWPLVECGRSDPTGAAFWMLVSDA